MNLQRLAAYRHDLHQELGHILDWWAKYAIDPASGCCFGRVDEANRPDPRAPRHLLLQSRILWAFSAGARAWSREEWLAVATGIFGELQQHFTDAEYGGLYWSVAPGGEPLNARKQIYGLAAALCGYVEYYRAGGSQKALDEAVVLFHWIERHAFDGVRGGYFEAFARDGSILPDLRLKTRDRNDPKTAHTHLYLLEAFTNLYRVWKEPRLAQQLRHLIQIFLDYIVNPLSGHLCLHFDAGWAPQSELISYGHDIQAAWQLSEAAEVLGDSLLLQKCRDHAVIMAIAAARGLDESDGGLWAENRLPEKHGWAQAEAMTGFLNAWQISGEEHFLEKSLACWRFTQKYLLDRANGEWFQGVDAKHRLLRGEDKAGPAKTPGHNTRACIEVLERITF